MKKIYAMLLLVSLFALAGCSTSSTDNNTPTTTNNSANNVGRISNNTGTINNVGRTSNNTGTTLNNVDRTSNNTGSASGNVVNGVGRAVEDIGHGVGEVVEGIGNGVGRAVEDIGNGVGNAMGARTNDRTVAGVEDRNNTTAKTDINNNYNNQNNARNYNTTENYTNSTVITGTDNATTNQLSQRATKIAKTLNNIDGVEKATVVITGETALVGLNLSNNLSSEQITSIKNNAEKQVVKTDTAIKNAAVTASPEIVDRIVNLANDVGRGKPLSGLADEVGSLMRRIAPNF